jgi:hypothetical protein
MTRSRLGLLGLCVVMLGTMALSAGAAQAEVGSKWLFAQRPPQTELVPFLESSLGFEADTTIVKHTKIAGISVLFECKKMASVSATLKANGSIGNGAKIKYSECITKLNGATSAPCTPKAGGTETGVINSQPLHALIELHELVGGVKDDLIKVLPDSGTTILIIEMSSECAIGTKVPIFGNLTYKDCEGAFLTHLVKHLLEVGPLTELWAISKTAEHVVTVLGSWWAFLTGAHEGMKWSGDPA